MSFRASFFKTILMLLLVLLLCVAGLFWFDFLGVIQLKTVFAPVYRILGFAPQTSVTSVQNAPIVADLEEDRFAKRLEALELEKQALDKRELIKISVLQNCEDDAREIAEVIAERTRSQVVQVIGKKIVLYKEGKDKNKKIELPKAKKKDA